MKIKVLFLLVTTTLGASGATLNTSLIDQLTGLKVRLTKRKMPTKSVSPEKMHGVTILSTMRINTWGGICR
jgi:hypothetical protein